MVEICTQFESAEQGVYIISGKPGVGKTSFFNITQFLLQEQQAPCGPKILCAQQLCQILPSDHTTNIALKSALSLVKSVTQYCSAQKRSLPSQTQKISEWMRIKGGGIGVEISLSMFGFSGGAERPVTLPPAFSNVDFESLQDILRVIVEEIVLDLGFHGTFIVLDNIENLEKEEIVKLFVGFRDTLFSLPKIWWIIIGQAGLSSLIKTEVPKVYERLSGVGLDLQPIALPEMHEAIEKRVQRFHESGDGKAPLPEVVHRLLYSVSDGEIRFVFKYSQEICTQFIAGIRAKLLKQTRSRLTPAMLDDALGRVLVKGLIPTDMAMGVLKHIVKQEIQTLAITAKERSILAMIGKNGSARASDFLSYDVESPGVFSSNYLIKLYKGSLLVRSMQGKSFVYQLSAMLRLAAECKVL